MTQQLKMTLGVVLAVIGLVLGIVLFRSWYNKEHSVTNDKEIMALVDKMNAGLPKDLDDDTRLERIDAGPGRRLTYVCTLVNYSSKDISKAAFDREVAPYVKQGLMTNQGLYPLFRKNIVIVYRYLGNDGVYISEVVMRP